MHDGDMSIGIITGASRGLGLALTRTLAARGWTLVVDARDATALDTATHDLPVVVDVSSDAAVEAYPGWGGYGSSKAALDHLTAVLAAERPELRVYAVDPGDMLTQLHQEAFPGEDISDRPPPEDSVPGLLELIEGQLPSGRYQAHEIVAGQGCRGDHARQGGTAVTDLDKAMSQ